MTRFVANNQEQIARAELYITAALSIVDMISDIVIIIRYTTAGNVSYALATLICVATNLGITALGAFLTSR